MSRSASQATGLRLRPTVNRAVVADGLLFADQQRFLRVRTPENWARQALAFLEQSVTPANTNSDPRLAQLVTELTNLGWLVPGKPAPAVPARLERQVGYLSLFGSDPSALIHTLKSATVAVIGVGGIGATAAQHLAGAGIGNLVLIDHDVVQQQNFNRQFAFRADDVGVAKVAALTSVLGEYAPETTVLPLQRRISHSADLSDISAMDVVLLGADQPGNIDKVTWSYCVTNGSTFVRAAVGHERGYVGPLLDPTAGHCLTCFETDRVARLTECERVVETVFNKPTPWSFGPTNTVIAAWAAHEIVQHLCGAVPKSRNTRLIFNFQTASIVPVVVDRANCSCGSPQGNSR